MKLFSYEKDGGSESKVWGFFLIEAKRLFSVVLLHFKDGSRDAYHSHAFNSISWVLKGELNEQMLGGYSIVYKPSLKPVITRREYFHQVKSVGNTWVISFRGPWANTWKEFLPATQEILTLTHGRRILSAQDVERVADGLSPIGG